MERSSPTYHQPDEFRDLIPLKVKPFSLLSGMQIVKAIFLRALPPEQNFLLPPKIESAFRFYIRYRNIHIRT